jgi:two-component system response regulator FixJ
MRLALAAALPAASDARQTSRPLAIAPHKKAEVLKLVTIVDDDDAIGAFTTALLERAGYRVVVFRSCDAFLAAEHSDDSGCVLLDMGMRGAEGLDLLRALRSRESMPPVVMLSSEGDIHEAVEAMKLGAVDFLAKPCLPVSLLQAIGHAVDAGPKRKAAAIDLDAAAKIATLSQRQLQVLHGVLKGKANKNIAHDLGLSIRTVETYRAELLKKLGVRGTAEAVRLALAAGML